MEPSEPAFLSIVAWPQGLDGNGLIAALATAAGIDPFHAGQRIARGTMPMVVQRIDAGIAPEVVAQLRARGVPAIAPTASQLRKFAPPIRAKRLTPALGAPEPMYMCEPWRDEPFGFAAKDIGIIVRARLGRVQTSVRPGKGNVKYNAFTRTFRVEPEVEREIRTSVSDIVDIYLRDRRRIRCSGDKFNFDCLGPARGYSDYENMDKLTVMLAESAPRAILDLGFAEFNCPPAIAGAYRTSAVGPAKDDHPVFDFYSPWVVQVYRALATSEKSRG